MSINFDRRRDCPCNNDATIETTDGMITVMTDVTEVMTAG